MAWIDMSTTVSAADYLNLGATSLSSFYSVAQTFTGDEPQGIPAARECAAAHACWGDISFGYRWEGSCAPIGSTDEGTSQVQDASIWLNGGFGFGTSISSGWNAALTSIPASYQVEVHTMGMSIAVSTRSPQMSAFFTSRAADMTAYEVTAVTAHLDVTPNGAGFAGTDWTGILRLPSAGPDRKPHFIRPGELGAYPQVGTVAPGGGTSLTVSLIDQGDSAGRPSGYFWHTLYVKSDRSDIGAQDLGLESDRHGNWDVVGSTVDITWRYQSGGGGGGGDLSIQDLDNEPRVMFEP